MTDDQQTAFRAAQMLLASAFDVVRVEDGPDSIGDGLMLLGVYDRDMVKVPTPPQLRLVTSAA